jgi:hypothetical protein
MGVGVLQGIPGGLIYTGTLADWNEADINCWPAPAARLAVLRMPALLSALGTGIGGHSFGPLTGPG